MPYPDIYTAIADLSLLASKVTEEARRISLIGDAMNPPLRDKIADLLTLLNSEFHTQAIVRIDNQENISTEDLADNLFDGKPWRLVLSKPDLVQPLQLRPDEDTLLFFSPAGFQQWLSGIDAFVYPTERELDFARPLTIRVAGLEHGYGGELLWVLPINAPAPEFQKVSLPETSVVQGLIHVNAIDKSLRVCPQGFALTWGKPDAANAGALLKISALTLSACLIQELKRMDGRYEATLHGTKRVTMPLDKDNEQVAPAILEKLVETVSWVYEERPETRLKLVMDRLSIDSQAEDSLLSCMHDYLDQALQQARDSYAFVILERKDAYHKEMRDLMKDIKTQSDLFAAKIRDLVAALTRDILAILAFIGLSFFGKFDHRNLAPMLNSNEFSLLVKFLSVYLLISCALQLSMHWRDANLSYKESEKWLETLQNYTSRRDREDNFLNILNARRQTLYDAMWVAAGFYLSMSVLVWHLPCYLKFFLKV